MAIRITGMYSGLDTESIISELASAQSAKKNKLVKEQTKLSWKQDAWKALNSKIYSFYTNVLDNMRFQSSYMKKTTKVSNSNAVSVVTGAKAPNSVQSMKVGQMAKEAYLTSGKIAKGNGGTVSADTTLADLGINDGKFAVKVNGVTTNITLKGDMKISDVVKKLESAGINASFDEKNQRFYLSSKESGAAADFTLTSNDLAGQAALDLLGFGSTYSQTSNEYKEYEKWAKYGTKYGDGSTRAAAEAEEALRRAEAKKASTDALMKKNEELQKKIEDLKKDNDANSQYTLNYEETDKSVVNDQAASLYDELYGEEEDGERKGGLKKTLDDAQAVLKQEKDKLAELRKSGTATEQEIKDQEEKVTAASSAASTARADFDKKNGEYSFVKAVADAQNAIEDNKVTIADNETYYTLDADGKVDAATSKMTEEVNKYFTDKIAAAEAYMDKAVASNFGENLSAEDKAKRATKIDGQDATISLNGVEYTSDTNTFEINGLTITVQQETTEEITLSTSEDTDGIYDMIKNFFTEYNKLINEMSSLYNAESSKGYDPLLSEEKAELADSEIEEWEKKIKDSLLRRDSTLGDVSNAMKTVMLQGATVNGKTMYLSDFGINTLGYFNAAENEKSAYHINGDKDDANVSKEEDTLRAMIASDPDTVMNFFSGLSKNLYEKLSDKMKAVKDTSSAFTVYNDKTMKKEYDDYKDKISKEETKLNALMDKWYSKFSAMETALAKLQSKNSAVSSMFGN